MATTLINVVRFTGLVVGVPMALAHNINLNGEPLVPDIASAPFGYSTTITATTVTVTRPSPVLPATADVLVWRVHTTPRELGGQADLTPQPYIIAMGVTTGGGGTGDVVGPAGATDNAITRFDGVTGLLIQNSTAILTDAGEINITSTGTVTDALSVTANTLTTGSGLDVLSTSADASTRALGLLTSTSAAATGTTILALSQAANQVSLDLTGANGSIQFQEAAAVPGGAPAAGKGKLWLINTAPNQLAFTNDVGTTILLADGDVDGPAGATDNAVVRFDGVTGKLIKNSTAILSNAGELALTSTGTTGDALSIVANSLTTGRGLYLTSSSADAGARNLFRLENTNAGATSTTLASLAQSANALTFDLTSAATTANVAALIANSLTTGTVQSITANALTTGAAFAVASSSADASTRSLATITSSAGAATGTALLTLSQAANQVALDLVGAGGGSIQYAEIAAVPGGAPAAARGKTWVRNDAPNVPMFTDDTAQNWNLIAPYQTIAYGANHGAAAGYELVNGLATTGDLAAADERTEATVNLTGRILGITWNTQTGTGTTQFEIYVNAVLNTTVTLSGATGRQTLNIAVTAGDQIALRWNAVGAVPGRCNFALHLVAFG